MNTILIATASVWTRSTRRLAVCLALCVSIVLLSGCAGDSASQTDRGAVDDSAIEAFARLEGTATVEVVTDRGAIIVELDGDRAPVTAGNFVDLVQREVYDGTMFHRVVRDPEPFVVQGGDPVSQDEDVPVSMLGRGNFTDPQTGNPRYIPLEILPEGDDIPTYGQTLRNAVPALPHTRGAIAMARSQDPNSASAQFYFALADLPFLDSNYAVFGYVTEGLEVMDAIEQGDRIQSIRVLEGGENLVTPPAPKS